MKRSLLNKVMAYVHSKCRDTGAPYLNSNQFRVAVPTNRTSWEVEWKEYSPPDYTNPKIIGQPWADEDIQGHSFKFNELDGKVNRKSHFCKYTIGGDGRPLNPNGRTGIRGRGLLGRWGPNHAADPLVTRMHNGKLEFIAIQRRDTGEWAIPGGMVDPGEVVSATLKREFTEEVLGNVSYESLDELWKNGIELYKGYVDDHRNTDNAWMETVVTHFHDAKGLLNNAGDDAANVKWIEVDTTDPLYASHASFIKLIEEKKT